MSAADEPDGATLLHRTGERIEALLTASATGGVAARERAEELVRLVVDLYGAGLDRLLEVLHDAGRLDDDALTALAGDPLVSGLLLVHGLHPDDVATRVARALDAVRPYLGSHGGDVELVDVDTAGVVRLRMTGSCDGCASSATTLELAVDGAVRDAAPEVTTIEVLPSTPAPRVIPLGDLRRRTAAVPRLDGWHPVSDPDALLPGRAQVRRVGDIDVVICAIGGELFAFRDRCGACGTPLGEGPLHRRAGAPVGSAVLRCPACGTHFDVRAAGAGLDAEGADGPPHLDPLPLLHRDGVAHVAVPRRPEGAGAVLA